MLTCVARHSINYSLSGRVLLSCALLAYCSQLVCGSYTLPATGEELDNFWDRSNPSPMHECHTSQNKFSGGYGWKRQNGFNFKWLVLFEVQICDMAYSSIIIIRRMALLWDTRSLFATIHPAVNNFSLLALIREFTGVNGTVGEECTLEKISFLSHSSLYNLTLRFGPRNKKMAEVA